MKLKLMTTSLLAGMVALAFSASAATESSASAATESPASKELQAAVSKLEGKIHASSPSLKAFNITIDGTSAAFQAEYGKNYFPIVFTGRRFITDREGSALMDPNGFFMIKNAGPVTAGSELIRFELTSEFGEQWPTFDLPAGVEKRGDLFVISDPTCGFCQKIDAEVQSYLDSGIQVHYIPYPRSGVADTSQPGFARWAAATCAEKPAEAYHEIALGQLNKYQPPADMNAACTDVIRKGFAYGQLIGVTGTPYMFAVSKDRKVSFANPGYLPSVQVASKIGVLLKEDAGAALLK